MLSLPNSERQHPRAILAEGPRRGKGEAERSGTSSLPRAQLRHRARRVKGEAGTECMPCWPCRSSSVVKGKFVVIVPCFTQGIT